MAKLNSHWSSASNEDCLNHKSLCISPYRGQGGEEEEEGTLGEVVVKPFRIPVAVEVGRLMLETTNIMIVVTTLQVMVR